MPKCAQRLTVHDLAVWCPSSSIIWKCVCTHVRYYICYRISFERGRYIMTATACSMQICKSYQMI